MTKALRMLLVWLAMAAGLPAFAAEIPGPLDVFSVHDGAWYNYRFRCAHCHGMVGQGIFPIGTPLRGNAFVMNARAQDIAAVIRNGRKDETKRYPQYLREKDGYMNMPPFDRLTLSDQELENLVTYLKGNFQKGRYQNP